MNDLIDHRVQNNSYWIGCWKCLGSGMGQQNGYLCNQCRGAGVIATEDFECYRCKGRTNQSRGMCAECERLICD